MEKDWTEWVDEEVDRLRQTRDELRVQVHLGAAEAKDAWEHLEDVWHRLQDRAHRVGDATQDAAEDVQNATRLLVDELKHGYEKIKGAL